jgi:hypothetical protein
MSSSAAHTPSEFFEAAWQAFLRAERASGESVERNYDIGGFSVRLRFASPALVPVIARALDHLAVEPDAQPALNVFLHSADAASSRMPPPPWSRDALGAQDAVERFDGEGIYAVFDAGTGALQMLDTERRRAVCWIPRPELLPYWESSFPLRPILHRWLKNSLLQLIHSAAVGRPDGGVLITGKGGSGKSTCALACLDSDLMYAGDDYVLASAEPAPFVHSIYNTVKLEPDNLHRFPRLRRLVTNHRRLGQEKALVFLKDYAPEKLVRGFPIRAILLPRVTGMRDSRLCPAAPAAALLALAPTTLLQLRSDSAEAMRKLGALVRKVPTYRLEAGTDLAQIPALISELLARKTS